MSVALLVSLVSLLPLPLPRCRVPRAGRAARALFSIVYILAAKKRRADGGGGSSGRGASLDDDVLEMIGKQVGIRRMHVAEDNTIPLLSGADASHLRLRQRATEAPHLYSTISRAGGCAHRHSSGFDVPRRGAEALRQHDSVDACTACVLKPENRAVLEKPQQVPNHPVRNAQVGDTCSCRL